MKIGSYIQKYHELDAWLNKSTQKENFLKILSVADHQNTTDAIPEAPKINKTKSEKDISEKLIGAAEHYMGKRYDEVDCYELVVGSLEKSGVNYRGKNGIAAYLAMKARSEKLPLNTYMTGEGLVEAAGRHVYSKTIGSIDNPAAESKKIAEEMKGVLEKGSILSFSMQTRGHTGIISKAGSGWTFINSGKMDHNIREAGHEKAVGEEPLEAEILNWLQLAAKKKEHLTITLGKFDDQKIASITGRKNNISMKA